MKKLKLHLYKFLAIFMPYYNRKFKSMTINYYINNWVFLQQKMYKHSGIPKAGDYVELYVDDQTIKYVVKEVLFSGDEIKILLM